LNLLSQPLSVQSGWDYSCALSVDNRVSCWGFNFRGQTEFPLEVNYDPSIHYEVSVAAVGLDHSCVVLSQLDTVQQLLLTNYLLCWGGRNYYGEADEPITVQGFLGANAELAVGDDHSCIIGEDSKL